MSLFHKKLLTPAMIESLRDQAQTSIMFEKNAVCCPELLKLNVTNCIMIGEDDVTSAIARCVEYGLTESIEILLEYLSRLDAIAAKGSFPISRVLLLRKVHINTYSMAVNAGFVDPEYQRRVIWIQRRFRQRTSFPVASEISLDIKRYIGPRPTPSDYDGTSAHYWGYRHTTYFLRYCSRALGPVISAAKSEWWGDCRYEALLDHIVNCSRLSEEEGIVLRSRLEAKLRIT